MSFLQLYYTSCERGLSGYAGYQFNAVTPGTSADTRSLVESLTGYEAPRSFAYTADREVLASCPVNLCYAPGPTTIVANVQYVGHDSSKRRFGNYFAHALATTEAKADLRNVLPIELWRAPFWVADQAQSLDLPPLEGPLTPGPLSPSGTSRFIAVHRCREQLPALLSAVGRSGEGIDRPVLVVADSTEDIAQWFAAISYLLPDQFVRRLSFATYLSRPSRGRLHLRGTVSETDLDLGADATENFCLFDFSAERFSPVPLHPLVQLTTRIDISVVGALWTWAQALAGGAEQSFDDWYPVTAAAAALGQIELEADDVAAAASWLGRAHHLPAARQGEIAWALHDCRAATTGQLVVLRDVAKRNGDQVFYEQAQCELLEADMLAAMSNRPQVFDAGPITDAPIRDKVSARCQEAFQHCDSAYEALRLLDWAVAARLTLDPDVVAESTRTLIAPWLLTDVPGHRLTEDLRQRAHRIARAWRHFRAGIVACLAEQGTSAQPVLGAAMSGLVGELLAEEDLDGYTMLAELYLVCVARRRRDRGAEVLFKIARRRGDRSVDEQLLQLIWPSGAWTRHEALEILDKLGPKQRYGDGVSLWFYGPTELDLQEPADLKLHVGLCKRLLSSPVAKSLTPGQIEQLGATVNIYRVTQEATNVSQLAPLITEYSSGQSRVVRQILRACIAGALTKVKGNPGSLAEALSKLDAASFTVYLANVERMLTTWAPGTDRHVAALWLYGYVGRKAQVEQADRLVNYAVAHWHLRELEKLARLIASVDADAATEFRNHVDGARTGISRRVVRSAVGMVTTFVRDKRPASGGGADHDDVVRDGTEPAGPANTDSKSAEPDRPVEGPGG